MNKFETAQNIIDFAVVMEKNAIQFYSELASSTESDDMKKVFDDYSKEEAAHLDNLLNIDIEDFIFSEETPITNLNISNYINPEVDYLALSYNEVLVIAMNREKRASQLYTKLSEMLRNKKLKRIFSLMAKDDNKHKYRIELEFDELIIDEN